jgi:hypothetical protein
MTWLGFVTGYSLLDVWTLAHTGFWLFVGSSLWGLKIKAWPAFLSCLAFSLLWEVFEEFVAFRFWSDHWLDPESWWNAWISDPMTVLAVPAIYWLLNHRPRRQQ